MVFGYYRAMDIPVAFALAGGYIGLDLTQKGLVDLHRLTIEAAVGRPYRALFGNVMWPLQD